MAGLRKLRLEGWWRRWGLENVPLADVRVSVEASLHRPRANMLTVVVQIKCLLPLNELGHPVAPVRCELRNVNLTFRSGSTFKEGRYDRLPYFGFCSTGESVGLYAVRHDETNSGRDQKIG